MLPTRRGHHMAQLFVTFLSHKVSCKIEKPSVAIVATMASHTKHHEISLCSALAYESFLRGTIVDVATCWHIVT